MTPHRAQQAAVYDRLAAVLPDGIDRNLVFDSIDTVERFQGQEKVVMIASFGLGDADQIAAEEQFMYSLNRFNVTASRAQAKFVALISPPLSTISRGTGGSGGVTAAQALRRRLPHPFGAD